MHLEAHFKKATEIAIYLFSLSLSLCLSSFSVAVAVVVAIEKYLASTSNVTK